MTLEHAVRRITSSLPIFGQRPGHAGGWQGADGTIFDLNTIGSGKRAEMRYDLPGGGRRLVMPAKGVSYTLVNGQVLLGDGKHTGALPGQVLRAGM
jgi:N-acyl-D-aspartate/D-glutamate deacylase